MFKKFFTKLVIKLKCKVYSAYLEEVATNALTVPKNRVEQEIEDILFDSMITAGKTLKLEPAAIAAISPMLRQMVAHDLAIQFQDKNFIKKFLKEE